MITAGIDIGSRTTKVVLLNDSDKVLGQAVRATGGNNRETAETLYHGVLDAVGLAAKEVNYILTTGYGRENIPFSNGHATEIICHAKGLHFRAPEVRMILDIGGQDSKAIQIDDNGTVTDFVMNDKCAAGTGRFIEVIANALGVSMEDLGVLSTRSTDTIRVSSMCTVFAESEVVSQVAGGSAVPDIVRGVHDAVAERSVTLLKRLGFTEPIAMTGGVAQNSGVTASLENRLDRKLFIPESPQTIGALGAAVVARTRLTSKK